MNKTSLPRYLCQTDVQSVRYDLLDLQRQITIYSLRHMKDLYQTSPFPCTLPPTRQSALTALLHCGHSSMHVCFHHHFIPPCYEHLPPVIRRLCNTCHWHENGRPLTVLRSGSPPKSVALLAGQTAAVCLSAPSPQVSPLRRRIVL